jgi:tetratricopeptide (TPR) repeat protein
MNNRLRTPLACVLALSLSAPLLLLACAGHRGGSGGPLGGMSVRSEVDPLIGLASYTDEDVLRLAGEAFDQRLYDRAFALYSRYLDEFPTAPAVGLARYNAALSAERSERLVDAIALYVQLLATAETDTDRVTLRFRLVACTVIAERWDAAEEHISWLLHRPEPTATDRFELRVQRAWVDAASGDRQRGLDDMQTLARRYRGDRGRTLGGYQGAMAYYHLGEVYRLLAEDVDLVHVDDLEMVRSELNLKASHIVGAQQAYLDTIRTGVHDWIPRAGYRLGGLYEGFRQDILEAPIPDGVTGELDREVYLEILDEQTAVLLIKARTVYRKVLDKASEVNMYDEWVVRIRDMLKKLEGELLTGDLAADI